MEIARGDLVVATFPGEYGKPRPALVIQSDAYAELASVTLLPLTSDLQSAPALRVDIAPSAANGLQRSSQIMVDKVATITRNRVGQRIGRADPATIGTVGAALSRFLGLAF